MNPTFSNRQVTQFVWIAYLIAPFSGLCVDLYVPALPIIVKDLNTSKHLVQLTLVHFLFALSIGQMCAGIITDRFGRKKLLAMTSFLHTILCIFIAVNQSIYLLILLRFLQGICVSFMIVSARAILADLFTAENYKQRMNRLALAWAIGIVIAPSLGAYIINSYSWQTVFYLLSLYSGLLCLCIIFLLQETQSHPLSKLTLKHVIHLYHTVLNNKRFTLSFILVGVGFSIFSLFALIAPFIAHKLYANPVTFGWMAFILGLTYALGNLASCVITFKRELLVFFYCTITMMIGGVIFLIISLFYEANFYLLLLPNVIMVFSFATMFPILVTYALILFPAINGIGNATFFSGSWLITSVIVYAGSWINPYSMLQYAVLDCIVLLILLMCFILLKHVTIIKH